MARNTKAERDFCIAHFPDLKNDNAFIVTSDPDVKYNCIGFAIGYNDIWIAPFPRRIPSQVPWFWWPAGVPLDDQPDSLIQTFVYFGFEVCNNDNVESGFDKVALYSRDGKWTHAARIVGDGIYHSKLGACFDIVHGRGDVMSRSVNPDESYGTPYVFMRRRIEDRRLLIDRRPNFGEIRYSGRVYHYLIPNSFR